MERNTFNILFYVRKNKLKKDGKAPLLVRFTVNGRRWDSALKVGVDLNNWDSKRERAIGNDGDSNLVNEAIESTKFRIHKIKLAIEDEGEVLTLEGIRDKYLDKEKNNRTILRLFRNHNDECKQKVGIQITQATYGRYLTCYKHLKEFINTEFKAEDLPISDINRRFYDKFEYFLKKKKKCAHNTTIKYIRNFNKIVRIAVENGWLTKSPYRDIGYRLEEIDKPYLTSEELDSIINKEITIKRLDIVRDIFVFCCHTGLSFSDIKELSSDNIRIGIDNKLWIMKNRKKTGIISKIPLLDLPARIIDKYKGYPKSGNPPSLLPVPSNQKTNAYLKEIADLCGIVKVLTTHTARRTFATTIMFHNGVSMEAVSKMLGHTSLYMTRKYAKADEYYIASETAKIIDFYSNKNIPKEKLMDEALE
jgi:integrase